MMTPVEKEAELISKRYHDALVLLGNKLSVEVLAAFDLVDVRNGRSFAAFVAKATALIYFYRRKARALSVAESQLTRALLVGRTYSDWDTPFKSEPTLGELRESFYEKLEEFDVKRPLRARTHGPELRIPVDTIQEIEKADRAKEGELDQELDNTFNTLGDKRIGEYLKAIKDETALPEARKIEQEAKLKASSQLAQAAERMALNGARDHDSNVIRFDRKIKGWARVHSITANDDPCGFCSMLLSRGVVYRTELSAGGSGDGDGYKFHGSCHCIPVKVYAQAQFDESPRFDKNREYAELWPQVTADYSGDEKRKAWARFIRKRNAEKRKNNAHHAQVAEAA